MSELTLESFITFRPTASDEYDFFPVPGNVTTTNGTVVVTLSNIPLPTGVPAPAHALTALYGFKDPLDEFKRQYAEARKNGMNLVKVSFGLEVGRVAAGATTITDLPETNFLNLSRLSYDVQTVILDAVNGLAAKEKMPTFFDRLEDAGIRPDLICDAIRSEPQLAHILAVVYKIPDVGRPRQVASIFTSDVTSIRFRGEMPFDLILPKLAPRSDCIAGAEARLAEHV